MRADIGRYASVNGAAAASAVFSRKLGVKVSKSTVNVMKKAYLEKKRQSSSGTVTTLSPKKRGRPILLGEHVDKQVQLYLKKIREQGGVVTASVVVAAARGILMALNRSLLTEFGGHITLSRHWAYHLLDRMNFVRRKATTSKSKYKPADFAEVKEQFLNDVVSIVTMEEIPPELVLNWDQTGIHLVPVSPWTMDQAGSKRVEINGISSKQQITAVFCGSLTGDFLPVQLIYQGKTSRCHPPFQFPDGWHITHSPRHWSTEETMVQYIEEIILPYVERQREAIGDTAAALVIIDNFKGQVTDSVNNLLEANNIHVALLPANATDLLQPMDIAVNKPAKDFLKRKFEHWYSEEVTKQLEGVEDIEAVELQPIDMSSAAMKVLTSKWLVEMGEYLSENPQVVVSGFRHAGISVAVDNSCESEQDEEGDDEVEEEADVLSDEAQSDEDVILCDSD